ncbi:creatininase family protein [Anaerocolumna sp. MB42-C2]|uniref:creatininase family protein n=1 Tax=Anaerocolumna sp. MB42-C2 TaxID=3070997 RepID=UPI0027E027C2|nr:creatininase family protein [Anaerocolumna sp. MB42-C2]WMJ86118.1 creatininase family protein [Anaerocolumna sp. MB42-C2]
MKQNIMEMNWTDFKKMNKEKTVVFLGFAPIEQHGKHLPLGVDVYETQYWMDQVIKELEGEYKEFTFLTLPVIPYGHAEMKGFPGNIHLSQKLFYDLVLATLQNVIEWGCSNIIIISGHADPKHAIAVEQACERIKKDTGVVAYAPMGAIFSKNIISNLEKPNLQLQDKMQQYPNDFHAGWIETSNMLTIRPDLVSFNYKEQPDIEINGRDMINSGFVLDKTKGYGHLGFPKEATKELGEALNNSAIQKIRHCVSAYLKRENYEQYEHHQLYHVPVLRVKED